MDYTAHRFLNTNVGRAVEAMFDLRGYQPEHARERMVPDGRMHLIIELDGRPRYIYDRDTGEPIQRCSRAWLSGVHSNSITIGDTDQESKLLAIQFTPSYASLFLHRDASEFCDRVVPAQDVLGPGVLQLRDELLGESAAGDRLARAETWLVQRQSKEWITPDSVSSAVAALHSSPGEMRWTEWVANHTSHSYKHFLSLFRRHVGPSPKVLQRILRFSSVLQRLQQGEAANWADLSLELGYSDQAHFVREFSAFSGYRPTEFLREGHDRVNFFPEGGEGDGESS